MALTLHTCHDLHTLAGHFCAKLRSIQQQHPLSETGILVPNHRFAQWLSGEISRRQGVSLNLRFRYLKSWMQGESEGQRMPDAQLCWALQLDRLLADGDPDGPLPLIQHQDADTRMRYAWQLAQMVKHYAHWRPEWLATWEHGGENPDDLLESLHARIWRAICRHRLDALEADLRHARHLAGEPRGSAPPKLPPLAFGFWEWSPFQLALIESACRTQNCDAFLVAPAQGFLLDPANTPTEIPGSGTTAARNTLRRRLSSRARVFQALLLDQNSETSEIDADLPPADSSLQRLRHWLISGESPFPQSWPFDGSIETHACSSRRRELEVVKAKIQQALLEQPGLAPESIQVFAPRIEDYAPWIPLVFSEQGADALPYCLIAKEEPENHPLCRGFFLLLDLLLAQADIQSFEAWLLDPLWMEHFGLSEDQANGLAALLRGAGLVAGHAHESDPSSTYNWGATLERILMSYAAETEDPIRDDRVKRLDDLELLDHLIKIAQLLFRLGETLEKAGQSMAAQIEFLRSIIANVLPRQTHPGAHASLLESVEQLQLANEAHRAAPMPFSSTRFLFRQCLQNHFAGSASRPRGGIRFASIRPEEIIPSSHTFVMGLQDGTFPRSRPMRSFDLMQNRPARIGDPSASESDAAWLLHSLCATGTRWVSTFKGMDAFSNETLAPSPLLQLLLDSIGETAVEDSNPIIRQPRFPYTPESFDPQKPTFAHFEASAFSIARSLQNPQPGPPFLTPPPDPIPPATDPAPTLETLQLSELIACFRNPARHFCEKALGIRWESAREAPDNHEPLLWTLDALRDYRRTEAGLHATLGGKPPTVLENWLQEQSLLPSGRAGQQMLAAQLPTYQSRIRELREDGATLLQSGMLSPARIPFPGCALAGVRLNTPATHIAILSPGKIRQERILEAWLIALCLWTTAAGNALPVIKVHFRDQVLCLSAPEDPSAMLLKRIEAYRSHQNQPLPFFPETSRIACPDKGDAPDPASLMLHTKWKNDAYPGESADPYVRLLYRGAEHPFDEAFYAMAQETYGDLDACTLT
jgi:exodeoxyribonuclease V gamma subunit